MNSWKIILATIIIFGAGVVTGGLLVNYVQHEHPQARRSFGDQHRNAGKELPLPHAEMMNRQFIQQLDDALHLSRDQRKAIEKILADGQQRNHELWKLVSPQFRMVMQDVNQHIRARLTPEQQEKFVKLMRQLRPQHRSSAAVSATNSAARISTNPPPVVTTNAPAM